MPRSRITGFPKLRQKLKRAPEAIRAGVAKAIEESIKDVQRRAVALVPVRTGNLRNAIASKQAIGIREKGMRAEFGLRTKAMRKRAFYAPMVEFGTKGYKAGDKRVNKTSLTGKQYFTTVKKDAPARPAQPFMWPAFEMARPGIRLRIRKALGEAAQKAQAGNWQEASLADGTVTIGVNE